MNIFTKHWRRLKRSLNRQWNEFLLPREYIRLGTKYGGWWIDAKKIKQPALLIDCGLGEDISFPIEFIKKFGGHVIGVETNPRSLEYCRNIAPENMTILPMAFWKEANQTVTFHLPRPQDQLPTGADGVSGSLIDTHEYVIDGEKLSIKTTSLSDLLDKAGKPRCDILKMDIEGAEYEVLDELIKSKQLALADQILIEFHHNVTHHTEQETQETTTRIINMGYELIYIEGRNYIFRKNNPKNNKK